VRRPDTFRHFDPDLIESGIRNLADSDLRNRQRGGPLTLAFVIELFPKVAEIRAYLR
jgi:hypothetical protein